MGQSHNKVKKRMKILIFDFDNLHGIANMYAVPVGCVNKCVRNPMTGDVILNLTNSDDVIEIPIYQGDSFKTEEVHQLADGGDGWDVKVSGIIPKRCSLNENVIQTLERGEWIVLAQDANGVIVLYGSIEVPLKFTHSRSSGSSGDINGSKFTFSAIESAPSLVLAELPTLI